MQLIMFIKVDDYEIIEIVIKNTLKQIELIIKEDGKMI